MRKDEFNVEKIINEDENPNFEFGETQDSESTSYKDNHDQINDEVNDNLTSNGTKRIKRKPRGRRDDSSIKGSLVSGGSTGVVASVATVVGASLIAITTLSTLIGINLFFNVKCKMNMVEPSTNSIVYQLDLTDISDDECIIKLENEEYEYYEEQSLVEGFNSGEFIDLVPSTPYLLSVIDISYNNYILYQDNVSTSVITGNRVYFDANGGSGDMTTQIVPFGESFIIPECTFEPEAGKEFAFWTIGEDLETQYQPGDEITPSEDITLVANWTTKMVTISFVANNGTEEIMEPIVLEYNTNFTLPDCEFSDPDERQMFAGWLIGDDTTPVKYYSWNVKNDVILTAAWEECYLITFVSGTDDEESFAVKTPADENLYYTPETCEFTPPDGYYFYCWMDDDWEILPGDYVTVDGDKTLEARWEPSDGYHISFDPDGGDGDMSEYEADVLRDGKFTLPECKFTAPDVSLKFTQWLFEDNYYQPGEEITIRGESVIKAVWGPNTSYSVIYQPGEGTGNKVSYTVYDGQTYELLTEFPTEFTAPEGYQFSGWKIGEDEYDLGEEIVISGDVTVIAQYMEAESTFNGMTFHAFDEDAGTMSVTLDYDDPTGKWSKFCVIFGNTYQVNLSATTELQTVGYSSPQLSFTTDALRLYEVDGIDAGNNYDTLATGSIHLGQFSTKRAFASVKDVASTSGAHWNDGESNDCLAVELKLNSYQNVFGDGDFYLRYVSAVSSGYVYSSPLVKRNGVQVVKFPEAFVSGILSVESFELVYTEDSGSSYTTVNTVGCDSLSEIEDAAFAGGYLENDAIPVVVEEAKNVILHFDGFNVTTLTDVSSLSLVVDFLDNSGSTVKTFGVAISITEEDLINGYVSFDLTNITGEMGGDFEQFISYARQYAANMKFNYTVSAHSYSATMYSSHLFKCA